MSFLVGLKCWIWNVLVALSQLLNALLLGDPGETTSSRAAKRSYVWGWYWLGRFLELIDPGHLEWSRQDDEGANSVAESLALWRAHRSEHDPNFHNQTE